MSNHIHRFEKRGVSRNNSKQKVPVYEVDNPEKSWDTYAKEVDEKLASNQKLNSILRKLETRVRLDTAKDLDYIWNCLVDSIKTTASTIFPSKVVTIKLPSRKKEKVKYKPMILLGHHTTLRRILTKYMDNF